MTQQTKEHRPKLWKKQKGRCAICGKPMNIWNSKPVERGGHDPMMATVDHIIPRSRGGTHRLENLRLVHYGCNIERGNAHSPSEYLAALAYNKGAQQ